MPSDAGPGAEPRRDRPADAPPRGRAERRASSTRRCATAHVAQLTPVPPTATAVFFGASYHADYATILAAPADLPAVAEALADYLADPSERRPWDVVDLRRLRCGDPAADALAAAFGAREMAEGWTLNVEREDVCPVVTLPGGADIDDYLATLGKKERHEIRRKVRRAEAVGEVRFDDSTDPLADLEAFIDLHQKRWGADGLFPDTPGGAQSRVFVPAPVRAPRAGRPAAPDVPVGRRPADRGGHPLRDRPRATSTTTPASTRTRATCRRAS